MSLICVHISYGGPTHKISVGGIIHTFEMHPYCGPVLLKKNGDPAAVQPVKFLEAASLWAQQGKRIEDWLCRWDRPGEPIIEKRKYKGRMRNFLVGHKPPTKGE